MSVAKCMQLSDSSDHMEHNFIKFLRFSKIIDEFPQVHFKLWEPNDDTTITVAESIQMYDVLKILLFSLLKN